MTNKKKVYLEDCWYVACFSSEVNGIDLFSRTILDVPVVIYRSDSGEPHALIDRCPHRFLPLSMGHRAGDDIVCHYHGLQFDCSGSCVKNPHGTGSIPQKAVVRKFPLVERDGFIWIWMGDPKIADANQVMDCSVLSDNPETSIVENYMHNEANYLLVVDNIMDLSHIDHIHGPLINTHGQLSPQIPKVTELSDSELYIRWDWDADPVMELFVPHLDEPESNAEQFFSVTWKAPSNMHLQVGAKQGGADYYDDGLVFDDFHIMTPETESTTHYFHRSTRNFLKHDVEYNRAHQEGIRNAFITEDKPVIDRQQLAVGSADILDLNPVLLSSDVGNLKVRRCLSGLISSEQESS